MTDRSFAEVAELRALVETQAAQIAALTAQIEAGAR